MTAQASFTLRGRNPDVLTCIANLSNDEVFTPPELANRMLDTVADAWSAGNRRANIWADSTVRFLDPCTKSGVFLREIVTRLNKGLEVQIPDLQARIDHILTKQVFGIGITRLTGLLARRSLYCSKHATGEHSIVKGFNTEDGNVWFERTEHSWVGEKCKFCGAPQALFKRGGDLETHAYALTHGANVKERISALFGGNMQFDVVIGNPPYQLNVGVEKENYAVPLYQHFVQQAKKLEPRLLSMVVPSRWFAGGRGLDDFREEMLNDKRLTSIVDFPNAADCFPGVDISGGVCYFLWDRDHPGKCTIQTMQGQEVVSEMTRPLLEPGESTFVRFNEAIPIVRKVKELNEPSFSSLVSPQTPFGFLSSFKNYKDKPFAGSVKIHTVGGVGYVDRKLVTKNSQWLDKHKLYISKSYGERGSYPYLFLAKPFLGEKGSCCTQTYLMIGPFKSESEAKSVQAYIRTKFFRFLIMLRKNTQDAMRAAYSFVPIQDWNEDWTDEKLFKKYKLSAAEREFIDKMVRPVVPEA
ncbi:Eco57I restriction-modification methylase domain-containing protein [Parafrankia sp. BMG5.11]|uniref:Eco57I restriction-modification methylase domain-containing protein n=1 Tax=Parafrankia sp. BMG5.11 TaxID=222540 RepID=UPI00103AF5C2|nr:Eco57I restriction-modification methylase domain-containing protein [Parafrankia sp. BMG5.11]TCJ37383.1 restriction endonuclease [Parafrankia sp. BMG5.11]